MRGGVLGFRQQGAQNRCTWWTALECGCGSNLKIARSAGLRVGPTYLAAKLLVCPPVELTPFCGSYATAHPIKVRPQ